MQRIEDDISRVVLSCIPMKKGLEGDPGKIVGCCGRRS